MAATKTRTYERELEVALWWRDFRATNNAHFLPLLFDRHRYLVLKGGGGSGKSIFAGRKVLERVTSEPGHRGRCARAAVSSCAGRYPTSTPTAGRRSTRVT